MVNICKYIFLSTGKKSVDLNETTNHRVIWFGRDLRRSSGSTSYWKQRNLDWATATLGLKAAKLVRLSFEHLQGWSFTAPLGCYSSAEHHHRGDFFLTLKQIFPYCTSCSLLLYLHSTKIKAVSFYTFKVTIV